MQLAFLPDWGMTWEFDAEVWRLFYDKWSSELKMHFYLITTLFRRIFQQRRLYQNAVQLAFSE